jgi:hypothetical protein
LARVPNERGPMGLKGDKQPAKTRKPIPKVSAKKAAHKATERALGAADHMAWVKSHPCCACGAAGPSEAHHVTGKRSDFRVIALCQPCHTGPNGYHKAKRSWRERHGPDTGFLSLYEKSPGLSTEGS